MDRGTPSERNIRLGEDMEKAIAEGVMEVVQSKADIFILDINDSRVLTHAAMHGVLDVFFSIVLQKTSFLEEDSIPNLLELFKAKMEPYVRQYNQINIGIKGEKK